MPMVHSGGGGGTIINNNPGFPRKFNLHPNYVIIFEYDAPVFLRSSTDSCLLIIFSLCSDEYL